MVVMTRKIMAGVQVLLCCGMLCALLVDWMLSSLPGAWRWMVAAPFLPALVMSGDYLLRPSDRNGIHRGTINHEKGFRCSASFRARP